jgi:hypothetical protein
MLSAEFAHHSLQKRGFVFPKQLKSGIRMAAAACPTDCAMAEIGQCCSLRRL